MQGFFGHPRGLSTLFFTEMWERFSYYGMRAILILFMVAAVKDGGLGFPDSKAGAVYGLVTSIAYLLAVPGGWIADRLIGQRKAVLYGGIIIALGNFLLAVSSMTAFYLGLVLVTIGTGLLKPNVSTMVGQLYEPNDSKRDAGFSIFYVGINLGAFLAPLVCGYLAQRINWHYGFLASAVGMTLGTIQYLLGKPHLAHVGMEVSSTPEEKRKSSRILLYSCFTALAVLALLVSGALQFTAEQLANVFGFSLTGVVVVVFAFLMFDRSYTRQEKNRILAIFVLFFGAALFWAAYEQAGSTLNLFADRSTHLAVFGYAFPASWFQSMNSFFIFALAPMFAWLWVRLGSRNPSSPAKFATGLLFVGLGFLILVPIAGMKDVSPLWLTATYFLHTVGELLLSPVGLSAMTKLAPVRIASLIMGVWFLATSVGDFISGRLASFYSSFPLPLLFGVVAGFAILVGLIMALLVKPMKRLMGGVN
jgi:POT family proton-dependent oligopeptide transporter